MSVSVKEFRVTFTKKYESLIAAGEFDSADVQRLMSDDAYCVCFAEAARAGDLDARLQLAEACFRWRCQDGINGLTEASFSLEALQKGSVYFHSEDREGHPIMYFRIQDCGKTAPEELRQIRQFIGWLLDLRHRRRPDQKIAVLFDMTNAGLANLNLELVRFVVRAFQVYYPNYLAYLFVYEMPWVLTAAWKVIRSWLDKESQKRIMFLKRSTVQEYIAPEQLWSHMGGMDDYQYVYSPGMLGEAACWTGDVECEDHFADADQSIQLCADGSSAPEGSQLQLGAQPPSLKIHWRGRSGSGGAVGSSSEGISPVAAGSSYIGRYMSISPADQVIFRIEQPGGSNNSSCESQQTITLTSTWQSALVYKVKTTCPTDYKVKPSSGLLEPGASICIAITYRPAAPLALHSTVRADKFQLLASPVPSGLTREAAVEALKAAQPDSLMEHRLRCRVEMLQPTVQATERLASDRQLAALRSEVSRLSGMVSQLAALQSQRVAYTRCSLRLLAIAVLCLAFLIGWSFGRQAAAGASPFSDARALPASIAKDL